MKKSPKDDPIFLNEQVIFHLELLKDLLKRGDYVLLQLHSEILADLCGLIIEAEGGYSE